jgi:hypothetical protein
MGRGANLQDQQGAAPRLVVPRGENVNILGHIAIRELYLELETAPTRCWPRILAERQVASYHVTAIGKVLGVRVTKKDIAQLRSIAAAALEACDLAAASTMTELVAESGALMREAAAYELATRCTRNGEELAGRATGGLPADPALPSLDADDWRALVVEKWRILPFIRRETVNDFLLSRLHAKRAANERGDLGPSSPVELSHAIAA